MPEPKRPLKVFLCHASTDKPKVRELYRYLKKRGIQPWFDEEDLVGGQDWQVEIPKALATSDAIIICLTKNSVDKEGYIQKEIKYALDKALEMPEGRIFLIPVKFEECEVPFTLSRYQWVDLTVESGYAKMMKALKFRASQLERSTVEVSKKGVEEENLARENKRLEAAERAERERTEKELRDKQAHEVKREFEKRKSNSIGVKSKTGNQRAYWFGGFAFLGLGGIAILILGLIYLLSLNNLLPPLQPTSTKFVEPSAIAALKSTSTPSVTQTSISPPTETIDAQGVPMMLVTVNDGKNFYMDKYEVTNFLYKTCVDNGTCLLPKVANYYTFEDYVNHPVVFVNQSMANNYCEWRNARLPTELEWKNASQGTKKGCEYANLGRYDSGWGWYNSCAGATDPVGSYELGKSFFGIYDLLGNVREWIAGTLDGKAGGVIGGSYADDDIDVEFTNSLDAAYPDIGFRCVRDITP
jgi:formylglycine-generating enzyme required for sulfatase activity